MKNYRSSLHFLFFLLSVKVISADGFAPTHEIIRWWFGPRVAYTFGGNSSFDQAMSIGFEFSYWNSEISGLDVGFEFGAKKQIIFTEAQLGIGFLGTSFGPYYNFAIPNKKFGYQSTTWINLIGGLHFRYRTQERKGHSMLSLIHI